MSEIGTRLDALRAMFGDEGFLQNKGLSNEVGLYIFAYPPEEEMAVRAFVREIRAEYAGEQDKCRVIIYDLYEILLDICRERRILDRIGQMEKQRGQEFMRQQIQRIAPPQAYVDKMKYEPQRAVRLSQGEKCGHHRRRGAGLSLHAQPQRAQQFAACVRRRAGGAAVSGRIFGTEPDAVRRI